MINECIFLSLPVIATLTLLPTYNVFIYFGDKVSQMMLSYVSNRKFYKINQNKVIQMLSVWSMSIKRVDMKLLGLSRTFMLFLTCWFHDGTLTLKD